MSGSGEYSMGLDVALGVIILLWAIRGWFKGFARQAIGVGALVGAVYAAGPIRDLVRPYATDYLPSIRADVIDRLLWWSCAVLSAVVLAGVGGWMLRWKKPRNPYASSEPNRADQGAGFLLGAAKGSIAVSFLIAAFNQYVPQDQVTGNLVEEQRKSSRAIALSRRYQPAERLWNSQPVQAFVGHIRRNGFWEEPIESVAPGEEGDPGRERSTVDAPLDSPRLPDQPIPPRADDSVRTARRTPALVVPSERRLNPRSPTFMEDVDRELRRLGIETPKSR
jgi:uncharacterized membrane protein required for colicin V production